MKSPSKERYPLDLLASIQPGYPFRGKLPLNNSGDTFVVQYRHVFTGESLNDKSTKMLDRVNLPGRKLPDYLRPGDVIFMAKGNRRDAAVIKDIPRNTVCAPNFYRIRLYPDSYDLLPEFLAWQLNHVDAQRYFATCSQGSAAPSITKSQLGDLRIVIPSIEQQKLMVKLSDAATREQQLLNELIENRQRMLNAVGHHILHSD